MQIVDKGFSNEPQKSAVKLLSKSFRWKVYFVFLVFFLLIKCADGQNPNQSDFNQLSQVLPPTPEATSIMKYSEMNVGLSNGTPSISVPIFQFTSAKLTLPISLNYTTSGFKVDEIASRAGTGWSLNAGGVITRTVRGNVDEYSTRLTPAWTADRNAYNYLNEVGGQGSQPYGPFDTQPDIFNFNFNGNAGSFILSGDKLPDGTMSYQPILLTYSNIKFDRSTSSGDPYKFRAITADGVQYLFNAIDFTTTSNAQSVSTNGCGFAYYQSVPVAWYLTTIIHPNHDTINLVYEQVQYNYYVSASQTLYYATTHNPYICQLTQNPNDEVYPPVLNNTTCATQLQTNGVILKQINSAAGGKIIFSYIGRQDGTDSLLSSVSIYQPDSLSALKVFDLSFTYPEGGSYQGVTGTLLDWHPFLASLIERSTDGKLTKRTNFAYNDYSGLPPRLSFARDHWGYFNGKNNTTFIPTPGDPVFQVIFPQATADRDPDTTYCKKGLLSSITYPTGGKDSLMYESNMAMQSVTVYPPDTVLSVTGGTNQNSVTYESGNAVISYPQTVRIHGYRSPTDIQDSTMGYTIIKLYNSEGTLIFSKSISAPGVYDDYETISLGASTYHIEMTIFGNNPEAGCIMTYKAGTAILQEEKLPYGGVRVSKMLTYDGLNNSPMIKKYYYSDSIVTAGVPLYLKTYNYSNTCSSVTGHEGDCEMFTFPYYTMYSNSITSFTCFTSSPASYGDVVEGFGENFENGGIEHKFTIDPNIQPGGVIGDPIISPPTLDESYGNGREIYQMAFKMNNGVRVPVREIYTTFVSDTGRSILQPAYFINQKYIYPCSSTGEVTPDEWNGYDVSLYNISTAWMYPSLVRTLNYDVNGQYQNEQDQSFVYGDKQAALPTQQSVNLSDGSQEIIKLFYPTSTTTLTGGPEAARQQMVSNNMVAPVLISQTFRHGSQTKAQTVNYSTFPTNVLMPQTSIMQIGSNPPDQRHQYYRYDQHGNLIQEANTADEMVTYLWDYKGVYPIAQITNADSGSVAYTSFEADGSGGWTIGAGTIDRTTAITGTNSFNLNSGSTISASGLNSATTYIVSYWTTNNGSFNIAGTVSGYPVRGKTETISGNTWTLYVHKVTGQNTISVSGSGGYIDELRLYPSTAQMTTYTYSPLVGMTTQTDVGNRITYYQYDGLQRLKRIRDQDYNILKTYEYQYQVPAGCSGCQSLAMQTFLGTSTIGYPVGVFDIHGNLVGNATGATAYVSLWNSDTADARIGTLSKGNDSLHFNIDLHTGQTLPACVTGCRYYQYDLPWNVLDGVRYSNGTYVDFGDGTGMHLGKGLTDTPTVMAPNTAFVIINDYYFYEGYLVHTYSTNTNDTTLRTITFYHNDVTENSDLDNANSPATSLLRVRNLRGNLPQNTNEIGGSSYQQPSALSVSGVSNWNSITSVRTFNLQTGDQINGVNHLSYAQDFLQNNKGLDSITTQGCSDTTFKISLLKSNWNTWFTSLSDLEILDDQWNREDISALIHLWNFKFYSTSTDSAGVIDNIINQIAAGAGKRRANGVINITWPGVDRGPNSQPGYQFLKLRRWTIYINGVNE